MDTLPTELVVLILSKLEYHDIIVCAQVCILWWSLIPKSRFTTTVQGDFILKEGVKNNCKDRFEIARKRCFTVSEEPFSVWKVSKLVTGDLLFGV